MKLKTDRESLLRPLQLVTGVVERRQTLPVLANLLVTAKDGVLSMTGTDLEVELVANVSEGVEIESEGEATLPARKLVDIWRSLPDNAKVSIVVEGDRAIIRSGRSRFTLATLSPTDFPKIEVNQEDIKIEAEVSEVQRLLDQVGFSMAQQDVRYFLNGMLLEVTDAFVRTVATDGHRLAMCTLDKGVAGSGRVQVIIPRKGVLELGRLLSDAEGDVEITVGSNHLRVRQSEYTLTTKLVDGKFPDYDKVIPENPIHSMVGDRETLRQSFYRASILSNEKYRGVRLLLKGQNLTIQANNPEQEEAEEMVEVDYSGIDLEIGFNVSYLQDVMGVIDTESVRISVSDANSSALIEGIGTEDSLFVVMPMRL